MILDPARLILVGRYPPPVGGNAIHIERLVGRLLADRMSMTLLDVYKPAWGEADAAEPGRLAFSGLAGARPTRYFELFRTLRARARDAVIHFHISAGANFYRYAWLLWPLTAGAKKRVLTIHSGGWVGSFEALGPSMRARALRVINSFDDVICVNEQQQALLRQYVTSRLHLIPAYLPPLHEECGPLPESVRALQQTVDVLIVASGCGTPVYDYETILRGIELVQARHGAKLGLVVAAYPRWQREYWDSVLMRFRSSPVPVVTTTDLTPAQFRMLLAQAELYVRATLTDGDAVTIREAASVGTRVLASDAVPRPEGTALFRKGDAEGLAQLLTAALQDRALGCLPREAFPDNYDEILRVYDGA